MERLVPEMTYYVFNVELDVKHYSLTEARFHSNAITCVACVA